jgi:hypothetical protein
MRLALLLVLFPLTLSAQTFPSLDKAIELTKTRALRSSNVNWPTVESESHSIALAQGEDAAIRYVLKALGDHHTFYNHSVPIAESRGQSSGIPVLAINSWSGAPQAAQTAAQTVRSALLDAASNTKCGIILDFTQNPGGNMWPMVNGLIPLFTNGLLGGFRDSAGKLSPIEKKDGLIYSDGKIVGLGSLGPAKDLSFKAIAIIVGPYTSSSGEITTIMFKGQPNVRFFGQPTSGYSTGNQTLSLPNGGTLILTTSITVDRTGASYSEAISPDQMTDKPYADAATWVNAQCRK